MMCIKVRFSLKGGMMFHIYVFYVIIISLSTVPDCVCAEILMDCSYLSGIEAFSLRYSISVLALISFVLIAIIFENH